MSKEKIKILVQEIKKLAQAAPPPPPDATIAPPGSSPPAAKPAAPTGGGGYYVNPAIKAMQTAMQEFASAATKYSSVRPANAPPPKPGEEQQDDRKKPFNDFIVQQYISDSPIKGQEYNPNPQATTQQSKQPTDLLEMNIVLNGLRRIGSPRSEITADSVWDFRTNNALKNIFAFAHGLVNLSKDFGKTNVRSFNQEDLAKLQELIPPDKNPSSLPAAEKTKRAKELTPLIEKLTEFYRYYVSAIATHPGYTRYISKNEPMTTIQKGGGDPTRLDAEQTKMMGQVDNLSLGHNAIPYITNKPEFAITLPSPKGDGGVIGFGSIPISALQNVRTLRDFMTSIGYQPNQTSDKRWQKAVVDAIMKHIEAVLNANKAPVQQSPF